MRHADEDGASREITLVAMIDAQHRLARWQDVVGRAAVMRVRSDIHGTEDSLLVVDGPDPARAVALIAPQGPVAVVGTGTIQGATTYATADALVAVTEQSLVVVGSPALYAAMLPHATQLDLVVLHDDVADPAGVFPEWRPADWEVATRTPVRLLDREIGTAYYMCLASELAAMPELKEIFGSDDVAFPQPRGH
jgi:hypothetical protein